MSKEKYIIEHSFKTSIKLLYTRISTPDGLSEWFCDDVMPKGDQFSFIWDGDEQVAKLLHKKENSYVRFRWLDDDDEKSYFEFKIVVDELTQDVTLVITDFCEPDEKKDNIDLWETQIENLHRILG